MQTSDIWDDDSDSEYIQNNIPPPDIDIDFRNKVLHVKKQLYNTIVFGPKLKSKGAQSLEVLQDYLISLNNLYLLALHIQKGYPVDIVEINTFPKEIRPIINDLLQWISVYFQKNQIPDTIPYTDYIRKNLHDYQYIQNDDSE
jgi:hypothetical protein